MSSNDCKRRNSDSIIEEKNEGKINSRIPKAFLISNSRKNSNLEENMKVNINGNKNVIKCQNSPKKRSSLGNIAENKIGNHDDEMNSSFFDKMKVKLKLN